MSSSREEAIRGIYVDAFAHAPMKESALGLQPFSEQSCDMLLSNTHSMNGVCSSVADSQLQRHNPTSSSTCSIILCASDTFFAKGNLMPFTDAPHGNWGAPCNIMSCMLVLINTINIDHISTPDLHVLPIIHRCEALQM